MRTLHALVAAVSMLSAAGVHAQTSTGDGRPLSDREKAEEAVRTIAAMREVLSQVNRKVEEARSERDALRLNCVNERRSEIAGLVKVAELSLEELRAAAKERQPEAVDHEYGKIRISRAKVDGLRVEADKCIGLLAWYDGDEVKVVVVDDNADTRDFDPTRAMPVAPTTYRPPVASPVR